VTRLKFGLANNATFVYTGQLSCRTVTLIQALLEKTQLFYQRLDSPMIMWPGLPDTLKLKLIIRQCIQNSV